MGDIYDVVEKFDDRKQVKNEDFDPIAVTVVGLRPALECVHFLLSCCVAPHGRRRIIAVSARLNVVFQRYVSTFLSGISCGALLFQIVPGCALHTVRIAP